VLSSYGYEATDARKIPHHPKPITCRAARSAGTVESEEAETCQ
jgi:hypothetical protein